MFSGLATAPVPAKIGVGFGFLLTAVPLAVDGYIMVKLITDTPSSGLTTTLLVLGVLLIAAFALAGLRGTQLVAAGNRLGCTIFVRPAYGFTLISLLVPIRAFTPGGGGIATFLAGIGLVAFCVSVAGYYRWLAGTMQPGGWSGTGGTAPPLTADERRALEPVVRQIPMVTAKVVNGEITSEEGIRRVIDIANGSDRMLAEAARLYTRQTTKGRTEHVRAIAVRATRLCQEARGRLSAESSAQVRDR